MPANRLRMAARRALESIRIFKGPVGFVIHHGNDTKWMWEREGGGTGGGSGANSQFRIVKNCYVQNSNYYNLSRHIMHMPSAQH